MVCGGSEDGRIISVFRSCSKRCSKATCSSTVPTQHPFSYNNLSCLPPVNMEYQFSSLISESAYETEGLCDGIPVRRHNYPDLETTGTIQAQRDWARLVAPLENHNGGLGPRYNFMAISMPECIPARFSIVSYANEFAFLYDGVFRSIRKYF